MKIVSFRRTPDDDIRAGALLGDGDEVLDFHAEAAALPFPAFPLGWFDLDAPCFAAAHSLVAAIADAPARVDELRADGAILARSSLRLEAPIPRPGKIMCIGRNYKEHAAESGSKVPERPMLFSKFPSVVTAPGDPVRIPRGSEKLDWEAELGAVIGRRAFGVTREDALDFVLGYTNVNDVTARDFQRSDGQWQRGKSCDTFAPLGPYVATADEIPDPQRLSIRFRLNGETMQDSNTSMMVFTVAHLVSYLSQTITLEPGDVIATGTPSGVGFGRTPPLFMKDGDRMEVEVEGLGVLANPIQG